jgi:hypothetical protein
MRVPPVNVLGRFHVAEHALKAILPLDGGMSVRACRNAAFDVQDGL